MSGAWLPWDSADSFGEPEDWPKPQGPSEWQLFRRLSEPKVVLTDAALDALAQGQETDSLYITFADGRMVVEGPMSVWNHVFHALSLSEKDCVECREVLDVFRRVAETLEEEEE